MFLSMQNAIAIPQSQRSVLISKKSARSSFLSIHLKSDTSIVHHFCNNIGIEAKHALLDHRHSAPNETLPTYDPAELYRLATDQLSSLALSAGHAIPQSRSSQARAYEDEFS